MSKPVAMITGCSAGIGFAIAKKLVEQNTHCVVITARPQSMDVIHSHFIETDSVMFQTLDVTDSTQIRIAVENTVKRFGMIDTLINNAGICYRGVVEHMDEASELDQLLTNYLGPMELIRKVLPLMREKRQGTILNVSSVSGLVPMPTMGSYSASKFALEAATEAIWYETRNLGIRVHLIQPGFVRSSAIQNVKFSQKAKVSTDLRGPQSHYYARLIPFIEKLMSWSLVSADTAAERILTVVKWRWGPLRIPLTLDAHLFSIFHKLLPNFIFRYLVLVSLPGLKGKQSLTKTPIDLSTFARLKQTKTNSLDYQFAMTLANARGSTNGNLPSIPSEPR